MLVGPALENRGLVFHHPDGSCLKPDAVSAAFVRRMRAAGLPRLTLKGLRQTRATLVLERGIHPRVVQEHAIIHLDERGLRVEDVRMALDNGEDIETRPEDHPYPARLVLGLCRLGALHVAVRDNIEDDEIIVETAYRPDPALWEPDFKTRRMSR
jgi:hypothetical protein